jgi:diadenosine tetraphosphate (Ap4A) HIT family hydrolase
LPNPTSSEAACLACDLLTGAQPLPGGRIHQTPHWVVEHCVGPLGIGTLVVKPIRHVLRVAELSDEESAELGPLLHRTAAAVTELFQRDQVYVCLWSHSHVTPGHIHFVVQPVTQQTVARYGEHGPSLQVAMFHQGTVPPLDAVTTVAAQARRLMAARQAALPRA